MDSWLTDLREDLKRLEANDLLRRLRVAEPAGRTLRRGGRELLNLAGNDYLALANHPRLAEAAIQAIRDYGTGSGASRLLTGHLPIHAKVEAQFAAFKHAEAALLLPTGYTANLAAITSLARPGDLICVDKLNHASLIDAARASGAVVRVFPHLDYGKLERLLGRSRGAKSEEQGTKDERDDAVDEDDSRSSLLAPRSSRTFIITDAVFSMDGDMADLPGLCDLADRYDAILHVDEAHGTGVLGPTGAGLAEAQGVAGRVDVVVSTGSKALGGLGGIITARNDVIQTMVNRARSFIFSTGVPASQAAAIGAALEVLHDEPWRREQLKELTLRLRKQLGAMGWLDADAANPAIPIPIIPLIVGTPTAAMELSARLESAGFCVAAIRPPTVAPNSCRIRLSLRSDLRDEDLDRFCATLQERKMI